MLPWLVALWRQSARTVWIFVVTLSLPFFQYLISWLLNYIVAMNLTEIRGFMTPWFDVELSSAVIAALALICLFYACYTGWGVCLIWAVTSKTMVGGTRSLQRVRPAVSALVAFSVVGFLSLGFLASVESIRVIDVVLLLPLMWCLLWAFLLWMITARTTNTTKERYCSFRRTSHIYAGVGLAVVGKKF